jgi:hypothetical protein
MALVDPLRYTDIDKIPKLIDLIDDLTSHDVSKFWIDVSEKVIDVSLNWKSLIIYDNTGNYDVPNELTDMAKDIIEYTKTISGLNRITVNFLMRYSFMPIHTDTPDKPDYDTSNNSYNMIYPVDGNGWSIVDYKVIKNEKGKALVFDGQVPHGAMNDTTYTRKTVYLLLEKKYFKNDCT